MFRGKAATIFESKLFTHKVERCHKRKTKASRMSKPHNNDAQ